MESIWKKTLRFGDYNIYWWAYPVGVVVCLLDRWFDIQYDSLKWDAKRAKRVIDRYFKTHAYECLNDGSLYYDFSQGNAMLVCSAGRKDREWASKYRNRLLEYLEDEYQIDGYAKTIEVDTEWIDEGMIVRFIPMNFS